MGSIERLLLYYNEKDMLKNKESGEPKRGCFSNHISLARSAHPARRAFYVIGALSYYIKS